MADSLDKTAQSLGPPLTGIIGLTSLARPDDNFRHGSEKIFLVARMSDPHQMPR